jgi:hypothetical protein
MTRWNTPRIALYGAFAGMLYQAFVAQDYWTQGPGMVARGIGGIIGGAFGGAILAALVSGLRNLFVRFGR